MAKRTLVLLTALALVGGLLSSGTVRAAEGAEKKFFLRSTGCSAEGVNSDFLALEDADEEIECFYTAAGARNEYSSQTPASSREAQTRFWDAEEGMPITLDARRPITGTIWTSGGSCLVGGVPCSPAGLSGGEVVLDITIVGFNGDTEIPVGEMTDTFEVAPGDPHATELEIPVSPDAAGKALTGFEVRTWVHGHSMGHGVIKTNGDHSSFVAVPTSQGKPSVTPAPPGKNDPPGVKKGCTKGKGKKTGCKKKKKNACPTFSTPAEAGKEAPTVVVTDAATEEAPLEQVVALEMSGADADLFGTGAAPPSHAAFNVQVDSKAADSGLYALLEFEPRRDYDLNLMYEDGSYAARSRGFNTIIELNDVEIPGLGMVSASGHGGEPTDQSEKLVGIRTADCGGYTLDVANYFGEGGDLTVKLWLGEATIDPQDPGAEPGA